MFSCLFLFSSSFSFFYFLLAFLLPLPLLPSSSFLLSPSYFASAPFSPPFSPPLPCATAQQTMLWSGGIRNCFWRAGMSWRHITGFIW